MKSLIFEIDIKSNVPELIKSDPKHYRQILFNLIGNSVKFTFKGFIKITVDFISDHLVTEIEDSGIGIREEERR